MRQPAPPVPRRARGARPPKRYYLADYDRRATEEPVALAIAWLRCLRSFGSVKPKLPCFSPRTAGSKYLRHEEW